MKANGEGAIEKAQGRPRQLRLDQWLVQNQKQIEAVLPEHVGFKRFARMTIQAVYDNPNLMKCTQMSLLLAVKEAARYGLEPDGRRACIVPYGSEAQFQTMYQGELELAWRTGIYEIITARAVHANDEFHHEYGYNEDLRHVPARGDRGPVIGYWAMYKLINGGRDHVYLTIEDCKKHRDEFSKAYQRAKKGGKDSAWDDDSPFFESMCLKTALLQVEKYAPKSIERYDGSQMRDVSPAKGQTQIEKGENVDLPEMPAFDDLEEAAAEMEEAEEKVDKEKAPGKKAKTKEEQELNAAAEAGFQNPPEGGFVPKEAEEAKAENGGKPTIDLKAD